MGRTLDEIIGELPKAEQAEIRAGADRKVKEMLEMASSLGAIRKALGKTQVNVAEQLGVKQNAISQLEKRQDIYLSTFKKFLKTLGMNLELVVVAKGGERYMLSNFDLVRGVEDFAVTSLNSAEARRTKPKSGVQKAKVTAVKRGPVRRAVRPAAAKKPVAQRAR